MIPRNEHPNPQIERNRWLNLNGIYQFEIDKSICGFDKEFHKRDALNSEVLFMSVGQGEVHKLTDSYCYTYYYILI